MNTLLLCFVAGTLSQPTDELLSARSYADALRVIAEYERGMPLTHSATFDGSASLSGAITATFDRDTAAKTYLYTGGASTESADVARYAEESLLFGAPTIEQVFTSTTQVNVLGSGIGPSGEHHVVLLVGNGDGSNTLRVYEDAASPTLATTLDLGGDGVNKPTDEDDLIPSDTDYLWQLDACAEFHGLMVGGCNIRRYDGAGDRTDALNWPHDGAGAAYSLDGGDTWSAWFRATEPNAPNAKGYVQPWSMNLYTLERDGSTGEVWIALSNYNGDDPRNAAGYVARATFGEAWTPEGAYRLEHQVINSNRTHLHCIMLGAHGEGGLKYLGILGDTHTDNRVEEFLCSSASGYLAGASARANALNVYESGTNWSGPTIVNGSTGATGEQTGQWISIAPGIADGAYFLGGDEEYGCPISVASIPAAAGDPISEERAWGYGSSDFGRGNWRVFSMNAWDVSAADPAVVAAVCPGNGWEDNGNEDGSRIVYKPAGESSFGVLVALTGEEVAVEQVRPVLSPAGYVWIGSKSQVNKQGCRRVKAPVVWREQRGVVTGGGATNYALATPTQRTAPGTGNTVTIGATPPEAAPCDGAVMWFETGTGSANMGHFRLSTDEIVGNAHDLLTVSMWVYAPDATTTFNAAQHWRAQFYTDEHGTAGERTGFVGPQRVTHRGGWWRLDYQLLNTVDWDLTVYGAESLRVVGQWQAGTNIAHPHDFYLVVGSVLVDADPGSYDPPAATTTAQAGDSETMVLGNIACGSAWTILLAGQIDDHARDSLTGGALRTLADIDGLALEWDASDTLSLDGCAVNGLPLGRRGDPILLALSWDGTEYECRAAIGGSEVFEIDMSAASVVYPTAITLGGADTEPVRWFYAAVKDGQATSGGSLEAFCNTGFMSTAP